MKISLNTTLTHRPRSRTLPNGWCVREVALLTSTAIALHVESQLRVRRVHHCVELLRFRFLMEERDGRTMVEVTPVISFWDQRVNEGLILHISTGRNNTVNPTEVLGLGSDVLRFITRCIASIIRQKKSELQSYENILTLDS